MNKIAEKQETKLQVEAIDLLKSKTENMLAALRKDVGEDIAKDIIGSNDTPESFKQIMAANATERIYYVEQWSSSDYMPDMATYMVLDGTHKIAFLTPDRSFEDEDDIDVYLSCEGAEPITVSGIDDLQHLEEVLDIEITEEEQQSVISFVNSYQHTINRELGSLYTDYFLIVNK